MWLAMIMSLAEASDRLPEGEVDTSIVQRLYGQAVHVCRQGHSPTDIALQGDGLRKNALDLSGTIANLATVQLPELENDPRLSSTDRETAQEILGPAITDLLVTNRRLARSLDLSDQVREALVKHSRLRRHARHWAVNLCAGDLLQLASAVLAAGQALDSADPEVNRVVLIILEAMSVDPNS